MFEADICLQGAPYKFAVTVQSKAFDEAPPSILKAIHRMLWAGKTAARTAKEWLSERGEQNPVPEGNVVFNELLSLGYMEDDRISVRLGELYCCSCTD